MIFRAIVDSNQRDLNVYHNWNSSSIRQLDTNRGSFERLSKAECVKRLIMSHGNVLQSACSGTSLRVTSQCMYAHCILSYLSNQRCEFKLWYARFSVSVLLFDSPVYSCKIVANLIDRLMFDLRYEQTASKTLQHFHTVWSVQADWS